jgi:hypothetical protein
MNLRRILPFVLALILAMTSQAMAVARGAADATGQMVICVGGGTVTIATDASGAPTAAPHICPDCVLVMACAPATPQAGAAHGFGPAYLCPDQHRTCVLPKRGLHPQTRAPPLSV